MFSCVLANNLKYNANFNFTYKSSLTIFKQITNSKPSESCAEACARNNLVCEPNYFPTINNVDFFVKTKSLCANYVTINPVKMRFEDAKATPTYFPGHDLLTNNCLLQSDNFLFSCVAKPPENFIRLCPCRVKL